MLQDYNVINFIFDGHHNNSHVRDTEANLVVYEYMSVEKIQTFGSSTEGIFISLLIRNQNTNYVRRKFSHSLLQCFYFKKFRAHVLMHYGCNEYIITKSNVHLLTFTLQIYFLYSI